MDPPLLMTKELSLYKGHYVLSFLSDRVVGLIWLVTGYEKTLQTTHRPRDDKRNLGTVYFTTSGSADVKLNTKRVIAEEQAVRWPFSASVRISALFRT